MLATVPSATLLGVDGHEVRVEVHTGDGLPSFTVVGLPDTSCREARDRVRSALENSDIRWPLRRITVNLAPSHVRKVGAGLDLAIAMGILVAEGAVEPDVIDGLGFIGELGLDGSLRPLAGMLPLAAACRATPIVPRASLVEARLCRPESRGASTMRELVDIFAGKGDWPAPEPAADHRASPVADEPDLSDVKGQVVARMALEVAAAGGHHVLMNGPPGAGKTMLAERLPGLLPDLDDREALDVTRVHSAAGRLRSRPGLIRRPPFRAPHHTATMTALVGGGSTVLRPGELSLASGGVLFLDELGEFPAAHLDALRQPLESGRIQVSRAAISAELPAHILLVAASNPCPCGYRGFADCMCSEAQLTRYRRRLSGPLVDRFDIRLGVGPPDPAVVFDAAPGETTAAVRERVVAARRRSRERGTPTNRVLRGRALHAAAPVVAEAETMLRELMERGSLTMRGADRVRAVALTLGDLAGESPPLSQSTVHKALMLRGGDDVLVSTP